MPDERRPWWKRNLLWEIPLLGVLGGFMLWVRMLPAKALVFGERAYYIGTDPFFHYREVLGIVRSFPRVPRWDPWTFYPNGTATNQFGTLFDWAAAAYVVVTQGKDASEGYIQQVLGVYPAILGALLIVPFYFLAKRLLGLSGAIVASITLAILPGEFLIRSIAGYSDHHVAEALMALLSILGVYVAAERGHAARDAIRARDWRAARKAILFGVLGGVALGLNFYAWPPALLFLAILTLWLTIVILVETARGNDPGGLAFGAAVAFAVAGLMMVPVIETDDIGDFNAYGLLQVIAPLGAAAWVYLLDWTALALRQRGIPVWTLGVGIAGLGLVGLVAIRLFAERFAASILWGLSWVTGIGIRRTTLTIAEARRADFLCSRDTATASCLGSDFGIIPAVSVFLLVALAVWVVWKRRHGDILLLVWSLVIFRATDTQIRFSYYLALNMALLVGWLAARIAEAARLEGQAARERRETAATTKARGRKARLAAASEARGRPVRALAVAAVLLLVLPGNVFAMQSRGSYPGWVSAEIRGPDGDLVLWLQGLDWMRENTPDAGVDLSLVIERPPPGEMYAYDTSRTYGVLSWWDYGHWIETTALRPPVANPFQQAAPFASLWFTEPDPAEAERMLDEWVRGQGPVRYVWIDDEMATGKYGAITVWAHEQNESRPRWGDQGTFVGRTLFANGQERTVAIPSAAYTDSMMARLYDRDAAGLSHYRLVYEHPIYVAIGNVATDNGNIRCIHDIIPSASCNVRIEDGHIAAWRDDPTRAVTLGSDAHAYDLEIQSRLKLFERVEGARLTGTVGPGVEVVARAAIELRQPESAFLPGGAVRAWEHRITTTSDAEGRFEIVWPYPTAGFLTPAEGGTTSLAKPQGKILVRAGAIVHEVDVTEREVLEGAEVSVPFT